MSIAEQLHLKNGPVQVGMARVGNIIQLTLAMASEYDAMLIEDKLLYEVKNNHRIHLLMMPQGARINSE